MSAAPAKPQDTRGLAGQTVGETSICAVTQTQLMYRGYEIADLAEHASFEEVAFLLLVERPLGESTVCTALGGPVYCFAVALPAVLCCAAMQAVLAAPLAQPRAPLHNLCN